MVSRRSTAKLFLATVLLPALSACQGGSPQPSLPRGPTVVDGAGYIALNALISPGIRAQLQFEIETLVAAGAQTIRLSFNSQGGDLNSVRQLTDFMFRIHATRGVNFEVFNVGQVSTAAASVFLAAQHRYARAASVFILNPNVFVRTGNVSPDQLRQAASRIEEYERSLRALLKARTSLADATIDTYLQRRVVVTASDALRGGIVEAIQDFTPPANISVTTVGIQAAPYRAPARVTAAPSNSSPPSMPGGSR